MHAVPCEKDSAPSALKRPDDKVQRIGEVRFPTDMAARCQHDQSVQEGGVVFKDGAG